MNNINKFLENEQERFNKDVRPDWDDRHFADFLKESNKRVMVKVLDDIEKEITKLTDWQSNSHGFYGCCGEEEVGWDDMRKKTLEILNSIREK